MSAATRARNVGAKAPPDVGPANTAFAVCVLKENVSAGVVVAVATEVVNKGLNAPALNEVTVPEPNPDMAEANTTAPVPVVPLERSEAAGCVAVNNPVIEE